MAVSVARLLTISLAAGVFLGLVAPLGTLDLPLALRLGATTKPTTLSPSASRSTGTIPYVGCSGH